MSEQFWHENLHTVTQSKLSILSYYIWHFYALFFSQLHHFSFSKNDLNQLKTIADDKEYRLLISFRNWFINYFYS